MALVFLIIYFIGMLGIGMYYSSKQTTVKEFVRNGAALCGLLCRHRDRKSMQPTRRAERWLKHVAGGSHEA